MDFAMGTLLQEEMNIKGDAMYGEEIGHSRGETHIAFRLAAAGTLILLLLSTLSCGCSPGAHDLLPPRLGDAMLTRTLEGEDARLLVNRMHEKGIAPRQSLVGFYRDNAGSAAVVYVSVFGEAGDASGAVVKMRDGILRGNGVFGKYAEYDVGGCRIAGCTGLEAQHYFFAAGKRVYWVAAPPGSAFSLAQDLLAHVGAATEP
jgi:hypothetical protein